MATVSKYKDQWRAQVSVKGKYRSKLFPTKIQAKDWAHSTEQAMGKHGGIVTGKTLGDALERFSKEVSPSRKGSRWEIVRANKLLRSNIANYQLIDLTGEILQDWIDERCKEVLSSSVNRELNVIAAALTASRRQWKWIVNNPMKDIKRPKNPPHRDRRISQDEIERILKALGYEGKVVTTRDHIAVAFLLALETAMRQGEIWGLKKEHLHLKQGYLTLPDTKNGTKRDVPLSSRAIELVESLPEMFSACSQQTMEVMFRSAVKLAGIQNLTFHDTRHEAITRLARKLDILDLARMVGHRDIRSLQTYYNPTASEIAKRLG